MTDTTAAPSELELARIARAAAEKAGDLIRDAFGTGFRVEEKSSAADLVTEVDQASERLIAGLLTEAVPGSSVLGEEYGAGGGEGAAGEIRWHIDPIDGTQNFVIGRAYFSVSIGIERDGRLIGGVVHDPIHRISYWATSDRAWSNETPLPSAAEHRGHLGVNTGQPFQGLVPAEGDLVDYLELLRGFGMVRSPGSIALQIADVATGKSAAAIELMGAAPWDIAGGFALAQATGCTIVNLAPPVPGYGEWGAHSFLITRDPAAAEEIAPKLSGILERGEVPERFAKFLDAMTV
jgi:myo-inositol-1(or 4)-monophosphatase